MPGSDCSRVITKRPKVFHLRSVLIFCLACALALAWGAPARAATPQNAEGPFRIESNPQLFAVMCALYASGFPVESPVDSEPGFSALYERLLALRGPATEALRKYYRAHDLADRGATLSPFITFALIAAPPPTFELTLNREELPPDVLTLDGFSDVLANFYNEAGIDQLWKQFEPAYANSVSGLIDPLSRVVQLETAYLREPPPKPGRDFTIYVEPLLGQRTNARNIGNHYAIMVSPEADSLAQIRHTLLHFFLDPLPIRYAAQIRAGLPVLAYAARAPQLPEDLRGDFSSFFTECLVRAVELRLRHLPAAQLAQEEDRADGQGYVFLRPLVAGLVKFEASEPSMTLFFPDLLRSVDFAAELKRVQTLAFFPGSPVSGDAPPETSSSALAQTRLNRDLSEGERLIAAQDAVGAAAAFERVLQVAPGQPRAQYGLAVAYILQGNADRARELFEQVVAAPSGASGAAQGDAVALAWSHVYLGRMNDLDGDRTQALQEYAAALAVAGAPDAARDAAQQGTQQQYAPPKPAPSQQ